MIRAPFINSGILLNEGGLDLFLKVVILKLEGLEAFVSVHRISLQAYLGIRMLTFTLQNDKAPAQKR